MQMQQGLQEYGGLPGFSVIAIFGIGSFQTGIEKAAFRYFGISAVRQFGRYGFFINKSKNNK
jgi:hypothetical protein